LAPGWQSGGVTSRQPDKLRVRLVQWASDLDPAVNRARLGSLPADGEPDLVVLPEAFAREFGDASEPLGAYAEALGGPFGQALDELAARLGSTVVAGMFETSDDPERPFNTLLVRGEVEASYRKIHLYDSFGFRESDRLFAGEISPRVVDVAGFRLGLMTCYDLRFPELARLLVDAGAEALIVPAAWVAGDRKVDHWRTLVRARAIENTVHVVAVGQPVPRYCGHSMVVDPLGDVLVEAGPDEAVLDAVLDRAVLEEARRTNPSLANRRL
jgi:predicted amidohydrolase